jgi:hypothetical protein
MSSESYVCQPLGLLAKRRPGWRQSLGTAGRRLSLGDPAPAPVSVGRGA